MVGIQVVQMDKLVQLLPDAEWTLKGSQNNKCGALRLAASELGLSKQNKRRTYCSGCPKCAVASNNGSSKDAHLVALAWSIDVDIWTTDRDFAGTGIASWSTPNLLRALNV